MSARVDAQIRRLTASDLDGALLLSSTAGWNQRPDDWRMLLQIAPDGSVAAVCDGRILGTAIGIDYGSFGWIAMMLVDPAYRGQGLGARLLESALRAIPPEKPVRLDATPMGRPLYQRYGFEDESMLTRHVAESIRLTDEWISETPVRRLAVTDLDAVVAVDRTAFGGDRRLVLEWARDCSPAYAQITEDQNQPEYCFGRPGRLFDQIGPVVARSDESAAALMGAALRAVEGKPVVADVFDDRADFARWLRNSGFIVQRPLFRMCKPGATSNAPDPRGTAEYTILGPEFA